MQIVAARKRSQLESSLREFQSTDWSLRKAPVTRGVHALHPYPAKFVPMLPGRLLDIFAPACHGLVLDPFCGSGTTLVEAQRRGIRSVGSDLNPIASLISQAKTTRPMGLVAESARRLIERASRSAAEVPRIPRLDHWFAPAAIRALSKIRAMLAKCRDVNRLHLEFAFSKIVVSSSRQESETRYASIDREPSEDAVFAEYLRAARDIDAAFVAEVSLPTIPCQVLTGDAAQCVARLPKASVGLVITSPPYPNAYEYWLYHKYRMYWLDHDPVAVREREIGARPHYFRKTPPPAADFAACMADVFRALRHAMTRSGIAVFVVGPSIIRGVAVDNAETIVRVSSAAGFQLVGHAKRTIPSTRKSFNTAHARIVTEDVLVLRRS